MNLNKLYLNIYGTINRQIHHGIEWIHNGTDHSHSIGQDRAYQGKQDQCKTKTQQGNIWRSLYGIYSSAGIWTPRDLEIPSFQALLPIELISFPLSWLH